MQIIIDVPQCDKHTMLLLLLFELSKKRARANNNATSYASGCGHANGHTQWARLGAHCPLPLVAQIVKMLVLVLSASYVVVPRNDVNDTT